MDYDAIFAAYYFQYRAEADTPSNADDEYKIGIGLANEAINRWANYDNTYWKELFTTAQIDATADLVVTAGREYAAPTNMREAGGYIRFFDPVTKATQARLPILEPQDAQFRNEMTRFAYFIGDPNNGFTLMLNADPTTTDIGMGIDYVYYKKPTIIEDGTTVTEMSQPYFVVHRMLANRFRASRNPYYQSAKTDAEDILTTMKMDNNSGNWADPWKLADNSGTNWGR